LSSRPEFLTKSNISYDDTTYSGQGTHVPRSVYRGRYAEVMPGAVRLDLY